MVKTTSAEKQTSPAAIVPVNDLDAPMTPTPRRKPQCKKCGKPMLGHKRGQCDGDATPTKVKEEDLDELQDDLTSQLADLHIEKPNFNVGGSDSDGEKKTKRRDPQMRSSAITPRRPKRLETVESLNSEDKALVDSLARPGLMSNNVVINESDARANIEGWLEAVKPIENSESPKRSRQKRLSGRPSITPKHDFDAMLDLPPKEKATTRKSHAKSAKPLGRTSSDAEREQFFSQLAVKSKGPVASVYTVEEGDIQALEENAKRLNFHVRVIAPKDTDGRLGNGWLVVGSDKKSVEELFEDVKEEVESGKVLAEVKEDVKGGKSYVGALGGIALGTAVTWIYLAYS